MKSRSPLFIVFFTIFIDLLGFGIVLPLSPYYAETFGASATAVGLLQASYSLMQFLFAPLWGRLSDRVGRRPIILMSIFGGFVSFLIFAGAWKLWILFFARMLQGAFGANISATQAYVADVTTKENRSKGMGLIGAAFGLGFIFGPAIGAKLVAVGPSVGALFGRDGHGIFGMGFPALVASFMCLANFTAAYFLLPESLTPENRSKAEKEPRFVALQRAFRKTDLNWLVLLFFLSSFAMANMESTLALFTEARIGYGVRQTGNLFAFIGVIIAFTQGYLIRKLQPALGERWMVTLGPLLTGAGLATVSMTHSTFQIALAMFFVAVGSGITNPAVLGGISLVTDPQDQGAMMGVTQSLGSLARILGPACGGLLFAAFSPAMPYYLGGLVMAICVYLSWRNCHKLPDVGNMKIDALAH